MGAGVGIEARAAEHVVEDPHDHLQARLHLYGEVRRIVYHSYMLVCCCCSYRGHCVMMVIRKYWGTENTKLTERAEMTRMIQICLVWIYL